MARLVALLLLLLLPMRPALAEISVVTTIRPLQFIAEAILGSAGAASAVIDAQDSPHSYTVTPSDRLQLESARLLVWIGPQFEVFLADIFVQKTAAVPLISAMSLPGVSLRQSDGLTNPHLWLDPHNALAIAGAISAQLASLDPDNAQRYQDNLARFSRDLESLDRELMAQFSEPERQRFAVYHDAYAYFEHRYGLAHDLALLENPEVAPGMRQVLATRAEIGRLEPACLFMESDSDAATVDTVAAAVQMNRVVIDLLGYAIDSGPDAYQRLLRSVAAEFSACLYR